MTSKYILNLSAYTFSLPVISRASYFFFEIATRGMGVNNYRTSSISGEEYLARKILPKLLNIDSPIIFDIGAHSGSYTNLIYKYHSDAQIYSFEPHPTTFKKLIDGADRKVKCFNIGFGKIEGTLTLYDRKDTNGSEHASLKMEVITEIHEQDVTQHQVEIKTLDKFIVSNEIKQVDFIKIDTEGTELDVLEGCIEHIKKGLIKCIQFEFNSMNTLTRTFMRDYFDLLKDYNLYRLLPWGLKKLKKGTIESELFGFQNVLAVQKNEAHLIRKFVRN